MIYLDGVAVATRSPATKVTANLSPMYLGALGRSDAGVLQSLFNGVIDDVQIFNYAKDKFSVADLYYDVQEIPLCLNPGNVDLTFDVAGGGANGDEPDCRITLADFAAFAQTWLNCGLYPQTDCL